MSLDDQRRFLAGVQQCRERFHEIIVRIDAIDDSMRVRFRVYLARVAAHAADGNAVVAVHGDAMIQIDFDNADGSFSYF